MAKIVIAGDAVVVKSELNLEDIKTIAKYQPKALTLMGGDEGKEPIFALGTTTGTGSINSVGASFGKADSDGKAVITMVMQGVPTEKAKDWVSSALCARYFLTSGLFLSIVPLLVTKATTPPGRTLSRVFAKK